MNKQKLSIIITAGVGVIATFLPWVTVPVLGSINGARGIGWLTLALFIAVIVVNLIGNQTERLKGLHLYGTIGAGLISAIVATIKIVEFYINISNIETNMFTEALKNTVSLSIGIYLVVLAGLAIPIVAFVVKDKEIVSEVEV